MRRVLVCGGRDYKDFDAVCRALDPLPITHLIEGGATGADSLARQWAVRNSIPFTTYEANWETHGRAAGPIRNKAMLDDGKPDLVVAFPGGRGTANMIKQAEQAGVRVQRAA